MTAEVNMIRSSLEELVCEHSSLSDLSCIDDVVVSYVCGVVEEIAGGTEEDIDAMEIKDVMSAYVPMLENISENEMESWVRQMVKKAVDLKNKEKGAKDISLDSLVSCFVAPPTKPQSSSASESSEKSQKLSENSDSSEEINGLTCGKKEEDQYGEAMSMILELFPEVCSLEVQHCLSSCGGLLEEATSLLLERQDQGVSIKNNPVTKILTKSQKSDEKTIRNSIVNRYGFIDNEDDSKEHRPVAPKWEGKKMVRYLDNKVVSLKGERYTEIRKEEADESKKTFVHLKPGKQYRFH